MKSRIAKRSITIAGHKTAELVAAINLDRQRGNLSSAIRLIVLSVSLEEEFWEGLKEIAAVRHLGL